MAEDAREKDASALACLHVTISGNVQGVFFRAFVAERAAALGVAGYVRNLPDGGVEVLAEGERPELEKLLEHLRVGPPRARVAKVDISWQACSGQFSGFRIRY